MSGHFDFRQSTKKLVAADEDVEFLEWQSQYKKRQSKKQQEVLSGKSRELVAEDGEVEDEKPKKVAKPDGGWEDTE